MKTASCFLSILVVLSAFTLGGSQNSYLINSEIDNLRSKGFSDFSETGLINIINDPSKSLYHQTALRVIALKGYKNVSSDLIKYYRTCNYGSCDLFKIIAASTLALIGDSTGFQFLHELLNENQSDKYRLNDITRELSELGDDYCINAIRRQLKDTEWCYRLAGIRSASKLVGFGKGQIVLPEIKFLSENDTNKLVRTEAHVLIDEISRIPVPYHEIPLEKVIDISKKACIKNGWKWENEYIIIRRSDRFVIHIGGRGSKNGAYITIDKTSGKVVETLYSNM